MLLLLLLLLCHYVIVLLLIIVIILYQNMYVYKIYQYIYIYIIIYIYAHTHTHIYIYIHVLYSFGWNSWVKASVGFVDGKFHSYGDCPGCHVWFQRRNTKFPESIWRRKKGKPTFWGLVGFGLNHFNETNPFASTFVSFLGLWPGCANFTQVIMWLMQKHDP